MSSSQSSPISRPREATPAQAASLCDQITRHLQQASHPKGAKRSNRTSPLNRELFVLMWHFVQILELASFDKRVLLTTPSHLLSLQNLVSELFKGLFCQKALSLFQKSDLAGQSWIALLRKDLNLRMPEMQLIEIEQLLDRNMYGDLSSSRNHGSALQINPHESKDLFEVLVDLAIYIFVSFAMRKEPDHRGSSAVAPVDTAGEFTTHIINTFLRHIRQHETRSQQQEARGGAGDGALSQASSRRAINKRGKDESKSNNAKAAKTDILTCLPSALTFLKLLQFSRSVQEMAKEKELAGKLIGILPQLFVLDDNFLGLKNQGESNRGGGGSAAANLNLNKLIASQGHYGNAAAPGTAGRPLQSQPDGIFTGQGGPITMESGRSNTLTGMQPSPTKGTGAISPSKAAAGHEDKERHRFRKKDGGSKYASQLRANSEPPNEMGLHYIHSSEDLKVGGGGATREPIPGNLNKQEEQKLLQLNLNQAVIASATRNRTIHKVPPILVNKIQNLNMSTTQGQNNFQSTNSSLVMNSFFNMPHGQLYQTSNTNAPNGTSQDKNSQYKFVSQPTLAKSRITRRQQSVTKNVSSNNLQKIVSGGQSQHQQSTSMPPNREGSVSLLNQKNAANSNNLSGSSTAQAHNLTATNPYKDAVEDDSNSRRSNKPKVPTLNFTKVLKQVGGPDSKTNNKNSQSPFHNTVGGGAGGGTSMLPSAVSNMNTHKFMNAQQATSTSNNAFIANNFLMPVASRQSQLGQNHTRTSRSPNSANNRNGSGKGMHGTESMFDDVNGSFAIDNGVDANPLEFINAEEKLQNLAIQLGESCLTHDLAALMSQKRDLELVESARKIVQKQPMIRRSWTQNRPTVYRSNSQQATLTGDLDLTKQKRSMGADSFKNQKTSLVQRANEILNKGKIQSRQQQRIRYRVVLLNIVENLLMDYNNDESRFLRQPVTLLCSYLESQYFQEHRMAKQMNFLVKGVNKADQKGVLSLPLDVSQLKALFGAMSSFSGQFNADKFFMQYDGVSCKLASLPQSKTEGRMVPPQVDLSVESSFLHFEAPVIGQSPEKAPSKELQSTRQRILSQKQTILLQSKNLFKAICSPEVRVVTNLLSKFQFVNEDILRSQVMNELSNFTNREKATDQKLSSMLNMSQTGVQLNSHLNQCQLLLTNGGQNLSPTQYAAGVHQSFDLEQDGVDAPQFLDSKTNKVQAYNTLKHFQCFWANNGIAYEVTTLQNGGSFLSGKQAGAALVSRESIRAKIDEVLYTVSRKIRYIFSQNFEMTDYEFSNALTIQIVTLNAYLEDQKSRTILHQVIDVVLEPLLMVKKALIEISLNTNILVMDFTRNVSYSDLLISAKGGSKDLRGGNSNEHDHLSLRNILLKSQQRLKDLFSEFLHLCGILLKIPQSADTLKLFNETFVYDEMWQEGIKTFVIALFLSDLVGPVTAKELNHFQRQQLEDLRGVNIVNFEHSLFFGSMQALREPKLYQIAKESVTKSFLAAMKILKYLKAVSSFYQTAIQMYFPQTFDQQSRNKNSHMTTGLIAGQNQTVGQPYQSYIPGLQANILDKQIKDDQHGAGAGGRAAEQKQVEADKQRNKKYWKHVIRKVLYQLMFLITQPNGLFYQYLQNNATNYTNRDQESQQMSKTQKLNEQDAYRQQVTPMNLSLTKSMLSFMRRIFSLPERFTKYVFDEELLLFYIRTNYISFVKLYNKNFSITKYVQDFQDQQNDGGAAAPVNIDQMTADELASPDEQELNVNHREVRKQASLSLCKKLLECLFAIARNRNEDTRRKMFQFKIVQFLLQEIGLEFEVQQRREKFLKLSKEQVAAQVNSNQQPSTNRDQTIANEGVVQGPDSSPPAPKPMVSMGKFKIPPLKTAGLGLSTILDADGKTQEEKDVENLVKAGSVAPKKEPEAAQMVPPLEIKGKIIADAVPVGVNHGDKVEKLVNETKVSARQSQEPQPAIKKKPFIPPLLGAKNLGMSTLMNENGKTQEELDVEATVNAGKQPPAPKVQEQAPAPVKKKPFIPPLLGAKNLGMSTLIQENGKTMEEMDVANLVAGGGKPSQPVTQPAPQAKPEEQKAPAKKPFIPPLLGAKNLGMSTLIQDNGKTREEMDVENQVNKNRAPPQQPQKPQQPAQPEEAKQAPAPVKKKPFIPPLLGAKNLGMSTLIQDNGKTMEEMDVANLVAGGGKPSQPVTQPAPQAKPEEQKAPAKKPFIPPLLGAKNLGMSTLIQDNGKTREEMDVENQVNQNYHAYQGNRVVQPPSDRTDDSDVRRQFGITNNQHRANAKNDIQKRQNNNDGEGSDSDESYYAELERIKKLKEQQEQQTMGSGLNAPNRRFVPQLQVQKLGFSTLTKDGQAKTQEEIDVENCIIQGRQNNLVLKKTHTLQQQPVSQQMPKPDVNNLVQSTSISQIDSKNQVVQQIAAQAKAIRSSVKILNRDEADASKRAKLDTHKKGLIRQSRSNMRRNVETEDHAAKSNKNVNIQNHAYQSEVMDRSTIVQSPQNVISGFHEGSLGNQTILYGSNDTTQQKHAQQISRDELLSPQGGAVAQQKSDGTRSGSVNSRGSHVGKNKIYVPHLSFPDDINVDPREKRKIHAKPQGDSRFSLKKTTGGGAGGPTKGAYGKKSKMLEFSVQDKSDQGLLDEPLEDVRPVAARGGGGGINIPVVKLKPTRNDQSPGGPAPAVQANEEVKSNRIKKISFLKREAFPSQMNLPDREAVKAHQESISVAQQSEADQFRVLSQESERRTFIEQKEVTEEVFYMRERSVRPIYQDDELHVLMLSLMMCLLLKPERGTLDELYCSQFPINDENQNILYLLHWHLSHPKNQNIVPALLKKMETVSPPLAGIRLLKLMCPSLFDISLYNNGKGWRKLAAGQYGIVYECQTKFAKPQSVAIKQMSLPQSISDRCVLHDIFTEITCLEEFRLEPCVTDLFDYGVDGTSYYIVMKKYSGSLREWRLRQKPNIMENLSLYLSIYREVLKAFKIIQSHNVTHYDIKCDNILIDFKSSADSFAPAGPTAAGQSRYDNDYNMRPLSTDDFTITVGDFGTCHMYYNDKDEFLVADRGTPNIKSPEMIELELNKRTDTDRYDRRKRVGTSRLSDVWSLGCLFYELLTGEMLFDADEYIYFFVRLTKTQLDLFEEGRLEKINNNVYLIDFLKYVLVRDPRLRPTIDNVLKRFEHVYALLVATSSAHHTRFNGLHDSEVFTQRGSKVTLNQLLQQSAHIMINESKDSMGARRRQTDQLLNMSDQHSMMRGSVVNLPDYASSQRMKMPTLMRIMEDVFISSVTWLQRSPNKVIRMGITHIVIPEELVDRQMSDKFQVFAIPSHIKELLPNTKEPNMTNPFAVMPGIMDFLRQVALFQGRVLFVESQLDWSTLVQSSGVNDQQQQTANYAQARQSAQHLVRECMLMCLAAIYQTSAYETYTLIKSQNLFFQVDSRKLQTISEWTQLSSSIQQYLDSYPKFSCMCGSCVIVLKRQFATYQSTQLLACQCKGYYRNLAGEGQTTCPSPACFDFITFLRTYYRREVEQRGILPENQLLWGFFEEEDFVIGPNFSGITDNYHQRQIASSISNTIDKNSTLVANVDKNRAGGGGGASTNMGGNNTPGGNIDMISRSSATRRNYSRQGGSALGFNQNAAGGGAGVQRWKLFKCTHCQIWTYAFNEHESRYAILLNNRIKDQRQSRLGLLAGQDELMNQNGETATVRVPILQKIKLQIPF